MTAERGPPGQPRLLKLENRQVCKFPLPYGTKEQLSDQTEQKFPWVFVRQKSYE